MSDPMPPKRSLSEISHLFLSSVRDLQTNGAPRPQRVPPRKAGDPAPVAQPPGGAKRDLSIDLTPEEMAEVISRTSEEKPTPRAGISVTAVLASHLNGRPIDRVKEYARHLTADVGRVGLIELDSSEFRVTCFESDGGLTPLDEVEPIEANDGRQMAEALQEMSFDIRHWLLVIPSLRTPEAKALLRAVDHWVLLSTCDHEGVVAAYRQLKGLADSGRPRLTLALLDAADESEIGRVYRKLAGVCRQFLNWSLEPEPPVRPASRVEDHLVLCSRPPHDKAQFAAAPQWSIVADFLASAKAALPEETAVPDSFIRDRMPAETTTQVIAERKTAAKYAIHAAREAIAALPPIANPTNQPEPEQDPAPSDASYSAPLRLVETSAAVPNNESVVDVIDLLSDDPSAILAAVMKKPGDLIECPLRPPMCVEARLAVARDRGIVLLAVARQGLTDLRTIGLAYRWMVENRDLLAMAMPQFAIDTQRLPRLRMLVDQTDVQADILQPMLGSENVTIQAYRRLRWGTKMGLFLEAA